MEKLVNKPTRRKKLITCKKKKDILKDYQKKLTLF